MLSLCINTVHSLLAISSEEIDDEDDDSHCRRNILLKGYSGLKMFAGDVKKPMNVVESVCVKKDSDEKGFVRSSGGSVMEAMSFCTESLGFESSDQLEEEGIDRKDEETTSRSLISRSRSRLRRTRLENDRKTEKIKNMVFPPPLSSLNQDGQPSFYLKSIRNDGRLQIKQARINRPEIETHRLHASRQNGRLTLHLIQPLPVQAEAKQSALPVQAEIEESVDVAVSGEEIEDRVLVEESAEDNKGEEEKWKFVLATSGGGGESYRRCYDLTHHILPSRRNNWVNSLGVF
ncbi:hypothetical protein ACHQM5_014867 [Ranunculus cassubicifolius]